VSADLAEGLAVSVCTIVKGRRDHLVNLINGLNRQTVPPAELVIAYMQSSPHTQLPKTDFPVRVTHVPGIPMPLAAARNVAAQMAGCDMIVFLDVDCIPSPTLIESYGKAGAEQDSVFLSEVYYLPELSAMDASNYAQLDVIGKRHPAKPMLKDADIIPEPDHGELWGLAFGIRRLTWLDIGGMDENYTGYGAEETDFAEKLKAQDIPLAWLGCARAYHQHHRVHIPPLQHFDHIVRNAQLFRDKWGHWCMTYWLEQFADKGLVAFDDAAIKILRKPSPSEVRVCEQPTDVLFS